MFLPEAIDLALEELVGSGRLQKVVYRGHTYYAAGEGRYADHL